MKKIKILCLALFLCVIILNSAMAQDTILRLMKDKADIVAHVEILNLQGGIVNELGVEEWSVLCKIIQPIKGSFKKDEKIRFRFNIFYFQNQREPTLVKKGKQYVIFLKGESGGVRFPSDKKLEVAYKLLDRWVGILPYNYHLVRRLTKYIE